MMNLVEDFSSFEIGIIVALSSLIFIPIPFGIFGLWPFLWLLILYISLPFYVLALVIAVNSERLSDIFHKLEQFFYDNIETDDLVLYYNIQLTLFIAGILLWCFTAFPIFEGVLDIINLLSTCAFILSAGFVFIPISILIYRIIKLKLKRR